MRFVQKIAVALLVIGLALGASAGCAEGEKPLSAQEKVYVQARELGYDGTLEEFLRLVAGKDGANGKDGASVSAATVNEKGELIVTLTDGTIVNAGVVRGEKGDKGEDGKDGTDGKDGQNGADGQDGKDGEDGADGENGQDGADGKDGASWLFGAGAPRESLGKTDDFYLDGETYDVYLKVGQGWQKVGNVKGADGNDGQVFLRSIPTMFAIMIPRLLIGIVVPLVMAELIFGVKSQKLQSLYRVLVLVPIVAPGVVGTLIWRNIFDPTSGLLTTVARLLGFMGPTQVIDWLGDPNWVVPSIIFMGFPWIGGTSVLIYMSGLMGISSEVLEASRLDGASVLVRIWKIDLPLLIGQIRYFLIFGLIGGFQDYSTQIVLTDGGPGYSTYVPGYYMYQQAFMHDNMGYASAIGSVMFVVIMVVSLFAFKFVSSKNIQGLDQESL